MPCSGGFARPRPHPRLSHGGVRHPAIQYLLYFVAVMWWSRVTWSVHLWTGAIAIAGAAGWLISYLVVAPGTARAAGRDRPGLAEMTRPAGRCRGPLPIGK